MTKAEEKRAAQAERFRQEEQELSRRFLADEDSWPNWPQLPVKSRKETLGGGAPLLGVILAGQPFTVYVGNMFEPITSETEKRVYLNAFAVVDAGWVVD